MVWRAALRRPAFWKECSEQWPGSKRKAQIVELKFFAGLTTDEIAATLGISTATVERDWKFARAWLQQAVSGTVS